MATGGKAQKQFFTDGSSYAIAQRLGHKITPLHPSLVQLKTDTYFIKTLKGIRADCNVSAKSQSGVQKACRGDVIFTDYGLSGNAIFGVSPVFSAENGMVSIDFLPDFSEQDISRTLENRLKNGVERREIFSGLVHNQIGRAVVKRADEEGGDPVKTLKNFTLKVGGTLGFDYAQTTCGGVDMRDIGDDLQSKIVKNLYFAGEILDVDGDCGGYNLHWAFTSAKRVAESILKAYAKA